MCVIEQTLSHTTYRAFYHRGIPQQTLQMAGWKNLAAELCCQQFLGTFDLPPLGYRSRMNRKPVLKLPCCRTHTASTVFHPLLYYLPIAQNVQVRQIMQQHHEARGNSGRRFDH
jgi:hypothetical protein